MIERVHSGIPGFDDIVGGGIPKNSVVIVAGGPGTGKTIFALQYIYGGASLYQEPGVFVTLEEPTMNVLWNLNNFGWDYKSVANIMKIYRISVAEPRKFRERWKEETDSLINTIVETGASRVAIDSLTALIKYLGVKPVIDTEKGKLWVNDPATLDYYLGLLVDRFKELGITVLFTAAIPDERVRHGTFGVEEFVVDGVVRLFFIPPHRGIFIRKMRGTRHSNRVHPFSITDKGIRVNAQDEILWEALR